MLETIVKTTIYNHFKNSFQYSTNVYLKLISNQIQKLFAVSTLDYELRKLKDLYIISLIGTVYHPFYFGVAVIGSGLTIDLATEDIIANLVSFYQNWLSQRKLNCAKEIAKYNEVLETLEKTK